MRYIIAGGAGFIGSNLARHIMDTDSDPEVLVLDNLYRRGSERNLQSFANRGIKFQHCDVRNATHVDEIIHEFGSKLYIDAIIDCVAEPAVKAGTDGKMSSFDNLITTNLNGTINLLNSIARYVQKPTGWQITPPKFVFLSTSRVYSIPMLNSCGYAITTADSTASPRSYYGTTKLAAELFVEELCKVNGIPYVIDRCGIVAGPGQFGKVDQGVIALWCMAKHFGRNLKYTGFGGEGRQVRDALHIRDLCELISLQLSFENKHNLNATYNVGGGVHNAFSLADLTYMVNSVYGTDGTPSHGFVIVDKSTVTDKFDVEKYVTDIEHVMNVYNWKPKEDLRSICNDVRAWITRNEEFLIGQI